MDYSSEEMKHIDTEAKEQDNTTIQQKQSNAYTYIGLYSFQDASIYVYFLNHQKAPDTYFKQDIFPCLCSGFGI